MALSEEERSLHFGTTTRSWCAQDTVEDCFYLDGGERKPIASAGRGNPAGEGDTFASLCSEDTGSSTPVSPVGSHAQELPGPMSPKSVLSTRSHLTSWCETSETCILLDWDDSLFPTTYVWGDPRLRWDQLAPCYEVGKEDIPAHPDCPEGRTMLDMLEQHSSTVAGFLRVAVTFGHVAIVTLAEVGWIETSIRHFLPSLQGLLEELGIKVVCARARMSSRFMRSVDEEGFDMGKLLKTRAMSTVIKEFYTEAVGSAVAGKFDPDQSDLVHRKRSRDKSWKNVLSIGDSPVERLALQDVIFQKKQTDSAGVYKVCRCKTVKIMSEPTLDKLTAELQVLTVWLGRLVVFDGDFDLDLGDLDEDAGAILDQ